jgi:O-antigen/teichoic acid export membrane protein
MYLPVLLLWKLSAEESVARFDLSHRVMMVMQAFLTMYLINLFTSLSREGQRPGPRFMRLLLGSTALAAVVGSLVAAGLAGFASPVLGILYSDVFKHPEATTTLSLLAYLVPVLAIRGHGHFALVALGRQRLEFACSLAGSVVLLLLLAAWVPDRAAVGAAQAMLVSEVMGLGLIWLAFWRAAIVGPTTALQAPGL